MSVGTVTNFRVRLALTLFSVFSAGPGPVGKTLYCSNVNESSGTEVYITRI